MYKLKNDRYKKARGGHSRILKISCSKCGNFLFDYQKDGPGILKRTYIDRIIQKVESKNKLVCGKCKELIGIPMVYKKEKRPAIRLFEGAVVKKITSLNNI